MSIEELEVFLDIVIEVVFVGGVELMFYWGNF